MTDRVIAVRRRERSGVSRMIGRWPDGIRFEDADVPVEGFFKGARARGGGRLARIQPRHGRANRTRPLTPA